MTTLSIIVPARTEKYLNTTINDVLNKATGEIEVFPVLDGYTWEQLQDYEKIKDKRVKYIWLPLPEDFDRHKRQAINTAVSLSKAKYVCWLDAHCVFAKGFDETLAGDCKPDWVMVPRRYKLNPAKWDREEWEGKPPIDYEYWMWQKIYPPGWGKKGKPRFSGYRWDVKSEAKKDIMIDDIFTAQGSFFFMEKEWFNHCKLMKIDGYTGWGQEGEEVCLTSILNGGRAVVDKNTWYAHMHKGQMHGRMYKWTDVQPSYDYSYNYWVHQQKDFFGKIIDKFGLFPNWPVNWREKFYG